MSRPVHFLDPYKFQIEEMVKLGCTDEHICRVLEDITGKEVKKRVIANERMWLRKMENKRKQYEPYKGEIKCMIEYGLTIQNIYAAIREESGIDASIETFKNFLKDNDMLPEQRNKKLRLRISLEQSQITWSFTRAGCGQVADSTGRYRIQTGY